MCVYSAISNYFGETPLLKGNLKFCVSAVDLLDFCEEKTEWKPMYFVLTKQELLGFKNQKDADSNKHSIFKLKTEDITSCLKLEQILEAISSSSAFHESKKSKIFVITRPG